MPAFYAHYRFGKQMIPQLPAEVRQCIQRFRRMYDMGLQGPDIFFFHNPVMKTPIRDLSAKFHGQTGQEIFTDICGRVTSEAAKAYVYGLLAHYCLDSACHPFVQKKADSGEAGHVALEAEFDRYLLEQDGISAPHTHDLSQRIHLTRGECMTVAEFYPPSTGGDISRCLRIMAVMHKMSASKNRRRTESLLKRLKPSICDGLIPEEGSEFYARLDSELLLRYNRAMKRYPELLTQLRNFMKHNEPLGEEFSSDFG